MLIRLMRRGHFGRAPVREVPLRFLFTLTVREEAPSLPFSLQISEFRQVEVGEGSLQVVALEFDALNVLTASTVSANNTVPGRRGTRVAGEIPLVGPRRTARGCVVELHQSVLLVLRNEIHARHPKEQMSPEDSSHTRREKETKTSRACYDEKGLAI